MVEGCIIAGLFALWIVLRLRRVIFWWPVLRGAPGWETRVNEWRAQNPEEARKIEEHPIPWL
jgi:hypothetical protein